MTITHVDPAPDATYSPAVVAGGLVFTAGQVGEDAHRGVPGDFEHEVHLALDNLERVLDAAGSDLRHVVTMTCYIADVDLAGAFNRIYRERVPDPRPARATVEVRMLPPYRIELVCVAAVDPVVG